MPDFRFEIQYGRNNGRCVIGIDEAGRGPWAGPVVAAAAWLPPGKVPAELLAKLDDSKRLTARLRESLCAALLAHAVVAVGEASVAEIDSQNILRASLLAMRRAVDALAVRSDFALVDGMQQPDLSCLSAAVVKGDGLSLSIAAASIVAKVTRDRRMAELARQHPGYGWERNQGYGTAEHATALDRLGLTLHHRRSFRPIRERLALTY